MNNELLNNVKSIIHSANGMNVGTGLQIYLEEQVNNILPNNLGYECHFTMDGSVTHYVFDKNTNEVLYSEGYLIF